MHCHQVRGQLSDPSRRAEADPLQDHLNQCSECRRFEERLKEVRGALRNRHSEVEPDASFTAQVLAQLPPREAAPSELLGWAALRLLPATLGLLLILTLWSVASSPSPISLLAESAQQDVLSWVLNENPVAQEEPGS